MTKITKTLLDWVSLVLVFIPIGAVIAALAYPARFGGPRKPGSLDVFFVVEMLPAGAGFFWLLWRVSPALGSWLLVKPAWFKLMFPPVGAILFIVVLRLVSRVVVFLWGTY